VIGLDTNVLARYFLSGTDASVATTRQEQAAQRILEGDEPLHVCKTVLLELEWVMRGLYATTPGQFAAVLEHLLALPHVTVEDRLSVEAALASHRSGLDFADALHHASYRTCASMASFDDRRFGRRAARLGLLPPVTVPR
jgi:predicted nucleic-acid-binding protein